MPTKKCFMGFVGTTKSSKLFGMFLSIVGRLVESR